MDRIAKTKSKNKWSNHNLEALSSYASKNFSKRKFSKGISNNIGYYTIRVNYKSIYI